MTDIVDSYILGWIPSKYTAEAVDEMTSLSAKFNSNDSPLGFALRAGLIANQNCPTLKKLLQSRWRASSPKYPCRIQPFPGPALSSPWSCTQQTGSREKSWKPAPLVFPRTGCSFLCPKKKIRGGRGKPKKTEESQNHGPQWQEGPAKPWFEKNQIKSNILKIVPSGDLPSLCPICPVDVVKPKCHFYCDNNQHKKNNIQIIMISMPPFLAAMVMATVMFIDSVTVY